MSKAKYFNEKQSRIKANIIRDILVKITMQTYRVKNEFTDQLYIDLLTTVNIVVASEIIIQTICLANCPEETWEKSITDVCEAIATRTKENINKEVANYKSALKKQSTLENQNAPSVAH